MGPYTFLLPFDGGPDIEVWRAGFQRHHTAGENIVRQQIALIKADGKRPSPLVDCRDHSAQQ